MLPSCLLMLILSWQADEPSGCSIVIAPARVCVCHSVLIAWLLLPVNIPCSSPIFVPAPAPAPVTVYASHCQF